MRGQVGSVSDDKHEHGKEAEVDLQMIMVTLYRHIRLSRISIAKQITSKSIVKAKEELMRPKYSIDVDLNVSCTME